jgi:glutamyl/glutaminyl-tRNA synthetase
MTVEAIRQFMLQQGPSQAIVSLEWDSIWAANKKIIDPIAPRHWAIIESKMYFLSYLPLLLLLTTTNQGPRVNQRWSFSPRSKVPPET